MVEERKPTFAERMKEAALSKFYEAILLIGLGIIAAYFGKPHLLEKLGVENPVAELLEGEGKSDEKSTDETKKTNEIVEVEVKDEEVNGLAEISGENVGFKDVAKYYGLSTKFTVLDPGPHKAPFTEVKSGVHELTWSSHVTTKKGGMLGIGGETTNWKLSGKFQADFKQNSLYALLKEGEEDFVNEVMQPLVADAAQAAIAQVDIDQLIIELEDPPAEISEEESQKAKLEICLQEQFDSALKQDYSVSVNSVELESAKRIQAADLSDPKLNLLAAGSLFRKVKEQPTKLENLRESDAGGVIGAVFGVLFAGVLILFVLNVLGTFPGI